MKKIDDNIYARYLSPQCTMLTLEVGGILADSSVKSDMEIKDPSWNTDGDYGLE